MRDRRFTQVPQFAIEDGVISDRAFRVYALLLSFDWKRTGVVYPSIELLAERLGRNETSVRRGVRELEHAGYIESRRRGRGNSNEYVLRLQIDRDDRAKPTGQDQPEPVTDDRAQLPAEVDEEKKTKKKTNTTTDAGGLRERSRPSSEEGSRATNVVPLRAAVPQ